MTVSQGAKANYSGQKLEKEVACILTNLDIDFQSQVKFIVECKRQEVGGTADQKIPFVYENLSMFKRGLLVLDGAHFHRREGILNYLNSKRSSFFDWCFVEELEDWLLEQTESGATPQ